MYLDEKLAPKENKNTPAPQAENSTEKATAPTVSKTVTEDAKTIVFALAGFMVFIFVLDKVEKWAKAGRSASA